jgi:hypothetical protein
VDSIFVGVIAGVVGTVVGGLLLNFIWQFTRKSARLRWFFLAQVTMPDETGHFFELKRLLESEPKVSVKHERTADGMHSYILDTVEPSSSVTLTLHEIARHDLEGVFFDGHRLSQKYARFLGPYDPAKKYSLMTVAFVFVVALWVDIGFEEIRLLLERSEFGETSAPLPRPLETQPQQE